MPLIPLTQLVPVIYINEYNIVLIAPSGFTLYPVQSIYHLSNYKSLICRYHLNIIIIVHDRLCRTLENDITIRIFECNYMSAQSFT